MDVHIVSSLSLDLPYSAVIDNSRQPDCGSNLAIFALPNESSQCLDLAGLLEDSPCRSALRLRKKNKPAFNHVFAISVQSHSPGMSWSTKNLAPNWTGQAGLGGFTLTSTVGHVPPTA